MNQPLYATISLTGRTFTLRYKPTESTTSSLQGYSEHVFKEAIGSGIPCVDFRTMDFSGYNFPIIQEAFCIEKPAFGHYVKLDDWLTEVRRRGATVTQL